jgi:hypothetical protein
MKKEKKMVSKRKRKNLPNKRIPKKKLALCLDSMTLEKE